MTIALVGYLAGALASVVVPFFLAYIEQNEPFDWRKIVGRLVALALILIPTLGADSFWGMLDALAQNINVVMVFFAAMTSGYGISEIGNAGQKAYRLAGK